MATIMTKNGNSARMLMKNAAIVMSRTSLRSLSTWATSHPMPNGCSSSVSFQCRSIRMKSPDQ